MRIIVRLHKRPSPAGHGGGMCKRLLKSSTGPDNYKPYECVECVEC
jgi:hypothetical protein